jgi:hypothetical protein
LKRSLVVSLLDAMNRSPPVMSHVISRLVGNRTGLESTTKLSLIKQILHRSETSAYEI